MALAFVGLCASACASSAGARRATAPARPSPAAPSRVLRVAAPVRPAVLRIRRAGWTLPGPLSREVVFTVSGSLELVGGLRNDGSTTAALTLIDPGTGAAHSPGRLAVAVHDAAGAVLDGRRYLFGGGVGASEATVQRLTPTGSQVLAPLPRARSDLAAAVVGRAAYLLGGYDGTTWAAPVLRTIDGSRFAPAARLPVPVRYPAVAVAGGRIWVFGGQANGGPTSVVQRIDVADGRAEVVGRMPRPLTDASAVVVGGQVLLCGGSVGGRATSDVQRFDPVTMHFTHVGNLSQPVQDAGSAVLDGVAYLLGGESPQPTASVQTLQFVPRAPAGGRS